MLEARTGFPPLGRARSAPPASSLCTRLPDSLREPSLCRRVETGKPGPQGGLATGFRTLGCLHCAVCMLPTSALDGRFQVRHLLPNHRSLSRPRSRQGRSDSATPLACSVSSGDAGRAGLTGPRTLSCCSW